MVGTLCATCTATGYRCLFLLTLTYFSTHKPFDVTYADININKNVERKMDYFIRLHGRSDQSRPKLI